MAKLFKCDMQRSLWSAFKLKDVEKIKKIAAIMLDMEMEMTIDRSFLALWGNPHVMDPIIEIEDPKIIEYIRNTFDIVGLEHMIEGESNIEYWSLFMKGG